MIYIYEMKLLMEQTENSEKSEPQMGFKPTTLRDLFGFSNHCATGDSGEQGRNLFSCMSVIEEFGGSNFGFLWNLFFVNYSTTNESALNFEYSKHCMISYLDLELFLHLFKRLFKYGALKFCKKFS